MKKSEEKGGRRKIGGWKRERKDGHRKRGLEGKSESEERSWRPNGGQKEKEKGDVEGLVNNMQKRKNGDV